MNFYTECERIKEERKEGLHEEFKNICTRIIKEFDEDPTLKAVRLENYSKKDHMCVFDFHDEAYILFYLDYIDDLYYASGFYDFTSEEGYNKFLSDLAYYMYLNTNLVVNEENNDLFFSLYNMED